MCTKPGHARIAVMLKSCSDSDRKAQERKGGRRGGRIPLGDFHGCMRQEPSRCGAGSKALRPSRRISPPVANVIMITGILITFGRNGRSLPPECATPGPNRSWCGFTGVSVDRPINLLGRRRRRACGLSTRRDQGCGAAGGRGGACTGPRSGVCTMACGNMAVIASGKPLRPSVTAIHTSATPRCFSSFITRSPNLASSFYSRQRPRISLVPAARTPSAICTVLLRSYGPVPHRGS
jgi:hypothetical protein